MATPVKEKNISIQALWREAKQFWPISILMMAFSFLAVIDEVEKFSKFLSKLLIYWHEGLHAIITFLPNVVLKLLGLSAISLPSPLPEIITIILILGFSATRTSVVEKSWIYRKRLLIDKEMYSYPNSHYDDDTSIFSLLPIMLLVFFISILLNLIPALIISYFLMRDIVPDTISISEVVFVSALIPAAILLVVELINKKTTKAIDKVWAVHYTGTLPIVLITAIGLVFVSAALEVAVGGILGFIGGGA